MPIIIALIAVFEGFSTLAVELIAIRRAIPVVGSSILLTGIILGTILLALALGYYIGGIISSRRTRTQIGDILALNLLTASILYILLSFWQLQIFLSELIMIVGVIPAIFVFAFVVLFPPVLLASQTLPLLAECLPDEHKGLAAGKMLFASTVGSFFGSIVPPIFLFETIGVSRTVYVVSLLLVISSALITYTTYRHIRWYHAALMIALILCIPFPPALHADDETYRFDSRYQDVVILNTSMYGQAVKIFSLNGSLSSGIDPVT